MTIGSLFSGIGGLELGLEWSGIGNTIWQVEQNEKLINCLATHWPSAERFRDVRQVGRHNLKPVDLICGGFPCQDVSAAGKRIGMSGARSGLWKEMARIIGELRPSWVVVENVTSGVALWLDAVRCDLEEFGYASLPLTIQASDIGAWHRRSRTFVIANTNRPRLPSALPVQKNQKEPWETTCIHRGWKTEPEVVRVVYGFPGRVDRIRALGNSVVPQQAQVVGYVIQALEEAKGL